MFIKTRLYLSYGAFKHLPRRKYSDKVLWNKAFNIHIQKIMDISVEFHQWFTNSLMESWLHMQVNLLLLSQGQELIRKQVLITNN